MIRTWFHGTNSRFENWQFPPPQKDKLTARHNALFFTSNIDFARSAGPHVAKIAILSSANILDTKNDTSASERLRVSLSALHFPSLLLNTRKDFWHAGWETGDVLRMAVTDAALAILDKQIQLTLSNGRWSVDHAKIFVYQNATRAFIDLICIEAKKLGFDAIQGHEVDRHTLPDNVLSQPWLAIMSPNVISPPDWLDT